MSLTEELIKAYKREIETLVLIPSDGGCFEVKKNDTLVFSKLAAGRFPKDGEVRAIFTGKQQPVLTADGATPASTPPTSTPPATKPA